MKTKKIFKIAIPCLSLVIGLLILFSAIFGLWNNVLLNNMEKEVRNAIDDYLEVIEVKSVCGKLNGNGNGMNFLTAVLVRAGSVDDSDLKKAADELSDKYENVECYIASDNLISSRHLQHTQLRFDSIPENGKNIVIVVYQSQIKGESMIDYRAH
ncbi:MAG: hypothetical protein IJU75_02695 [Clostridia bacterium]|nr:hypothetical protein [Clostridia bacterium]